jgi:hypothetical protein
LPAFSWHSSSVFSAVVEIRRRRKRPPSSIVSEGILMPENRGIFAVIGGLLLALLFGLFGRGRDPG